MTDRVLISLPGIGTLALDREVYEDALHQRPAMNRWLMQTSSPPRSVCQSHGSRPPLARSHSFARVRSLASRFTSGATADVGAYTQAFNSMQGAYKTLGCLERRARNVRSLREVMGGAA